MRCKTRGYNNERHRGKMIPTSVEELVMLLLREQSYRIEPSP